MSLRIWIASSALLALVLLASACSSPNPQPPGLTPIPTLAPGATATLIPGLEPAAAATAPAPTITAAAQDAAALGAPVYLKNCSPCHGIEGQGVDAPPLRNSQFVQKEGDRAIFETIANGRAGTKMPAWFNANGGSLTDTQIEYVIAYLQTLQNVSSLPTATPLPLPPTETPLPPNAPTSEPARPSLPGGPGKAVNLTGDVARGRVAFGNYCAACHGPEGVMGIPNPGSDDGSVPTLNPIDLTIANSDAKIFATNVDLFVEHGSVPSGLSPLLLMPPFGDSKMLSDQQIADLIAYVISLSSK